MQRRPNLLGMGFAMVLVALAGSAGAQGFSAGPVLRGPDLSLPGDKGVARLIDILQLDRQDKQVGEPVQVACPATGCQTVLKLRTSGDAEPEPFLLSVQFVARGAYVTLTPRSAATAEVQQFEQGHKGAIFVSLRTPGRIVKRMEFIVVRSASVRELEQKNNGQVLASGQVFNRKREPDLVLRVEFSPAQG